MGSIHSGRRDGKLLVEDCLGLDLAWLMRLGPIRGGQVGSGEINWHADGAAVRSARFRLDLRNLDTARLTICSEATKQTVGLFAVPQHFGGYRWWFRCPVTNTRARVLYLPPGSDRFASRSAWRLAYRVERLNRFDRGFEKLFRAQRKIGNTRGLGTGLERPKGMWRRTFVRHAERLQILDLNCALEIAAMIERA